MSAILDSGFLYAVLDKGDKNHKPVVQTLSYLQEDSLILPTVVLVEVSYLLYARLGHQYMRNFLSQMESSSFLFKPITQKDLFRVNQILTQYKDANLDFVDAAIVALAEKLTIKKILTVDQRDFRMIRPTHCDYFEILP